MLTKEEERKVREHLRLMKTSLSFAIRELKKAREELENITAVYKYRYVEPFLNGASVLVDRASNRLDTFDREYMALKKLYEEG